MESGDMHCEKAQKKVYREWDTQDVSTWLKDSLKLPQYSETFKEIGVDGQIMDHITEVDLQEDFGIKVRLHRVKIIEGIKKLQVNENARKTPPSSEIVHKSVATPALQSAQQQNNNYQPAQPHVQTNQRVVEESAMHGVANQNINMQNLHANQYSTPAAAQQQQTSAHASHLNQAPIPRHHMPAGSEVGYQGAQPSNNNNNLIQQYLPQGAAAASSVNQHHAPVQQQMMGSQPSHYHQSQQQQQQQQLQQQQQNDVHMQGATSMGSGAPLSHLVGSNQDQNVANRNNLNKPQQTQQYGVAAGHENAQLQQHNQPQRNQPHLATNPISSANQHGQNAFGVASTQPPNQQQMDVQMMNDNNEVNQAPQRSGTIPSGSQGAQANHAGIQNAATSAAIGQQHRMQQSQMMYRQGSNPSSGGGAADSGQNPPPQSFNRQHSGENQQLSAAAHMQQQQQVQQQQQAAANRQQRVDTPPHAHSRNNNGSNEGGAMAQGQAAQSIFANNLTSSASSEGMHVFVNSQGGGLAVNGGKFVAASQQYLQELAKNQAASEFQSELQQSDILVLKAVEGQLLNNVYIIGDNGAALGRHSASNDMVISESFVSRRHCEIKYVEANNQAERSPPSSDGDLTNFYLRDIGSTTGTFIMVRQEVALTSNMMFQMGLSEFKVVTTSKPTMCELHVFEGPARNRMVPVDESGLTIGRDQQNSFCVQEDSQMSNYHAKISYKPAVGPPGPNQQQRQGFYLNDVGSTNRTWLRLSAEGEQSALHPLRVGDILKIGSTVFVVESSDIHNLKYMPIINKRAQNGQFNQGDVAANQDIDGLGEQNQLAGPSGGPGSGGEIDGDGDLMILEDEEELKEPHEHRHEAQQHLNVAKPESQDAQQQNPSAMSAGAQAEMCKLCYENECDAAFIPCGHVTACIKCATRCQQCPVCRVTYYDIVKLYRQ